MDINPESFCSTFGVHIKILNTMKKYIPNTILKPFWLEKSLETIILFSLLIIINYLLNHYVFEKAILWSDIIITIIICILYLIAGLTSKTIIHKETKTIKNIYYGKITNYHLDDILSMTIYPNNKFVGNIKLHLKNGKDKGISISDISSFTDEIKNLSNEIKIEYK